GRVLVRPGGPKAGVVGNVEDRVDTQEAVRIDRHAAGCGLSKRQGCRVDAAAIECLRVAIDRLVVDDLGSGGARAVALRPERGAVVPVALMSARGPRVANR